MATTTAELRLRGLRARGVPRAPLVLAAILAVEVALAGAVVDARLLPLLLLAALAVLALMLARWPALSVVAAAVLVASVLPATLIKAPVGPLEVRGHELMIGGLVALAVVAPRGRSWGGVPVGFAAAFLGVLTLSTLLAITTGGTTTSEAWSSGRAFVPFALVLALPRLFPDRSAMLRVLEGGVLVAALTGAFAVLFALAPQAAELIPGGSDRIDTGEAYDGGSRIRLPGSALTYLLLLYAVVRLVQASAARRALWGLAVALMAANVALSLNRNVWLALLVGLGLLLALSGAGLRRSLVVGGLGMAAVACALIIALGETGPVSGPVGTVIERGGTLLTPRDVLREDSLQSRADETAKAWEAIGGAPLTGIGPGTEFGVYYNAERADGRWVRSDQLFLHNQYLYLLLVAGAPGLLLFLGFFVATGREGWRGRADPQVVALTAGVAMTAVSALVMISIASPTYLFALSLLAAGILVLGRSTSDRGHGAVEGDSSPRAPRGVGTKIGGQLPSHAPRSGGALT